MTLSRWTRIVPLLLVLALALPALAQPDEQPEVPAQAQAQQADLTVAVLDFSTRDPANADLGGQIADVIGATLTGEAGFRMVDRSALQRILQEQELNLTGAVDANQAVEIGRLAGAKLMITGSAFQLGTKTFMTAKIIGVETSLVESVIAKGEDDTAIEDLLMELADSLAVRLRETGPGLVARDEAIDRFPVLKEALQDRARPVVAVVITEEHMSGPEAAARQAPTPDPAVETEVKRILLEAGFEVQDVAANELAQWVDRVTADRQQPWPRHLEGVDMVVTGEAFSERGARIGNLVSCAGRAELNVIDRRSGRIRVADRTEARAVDLSEQLAGKKALQKCGRAIGLALLRHFVEVLPEAEGEADAG